MGDCMAIEFRKNVVDIHGEMLGSNIRSMA